VALVIFLSFAKPSFIYLDVIFSSESATLSSN